MEGEGDLMIVQIKAGGGVLGSVRVFVKALACHRQLDMIGKLLTEGETQVDDTIV